MRPGRCSRSLSLVTSKRLPADATALVSRLLFACFRRSKVRLASFSSDQSIDYEPTNDSAGTSTTLTGFSRYSMLEMDMLRTLFMRPAASCTFCVNTPPTRVTEPESSLLFVKQSRSSAFTSSCYYPWYAAAASRCMRPPSRLPRDPFLCCIFMMDSANLFMCT